MADIPVTADGGDPLLVELKAEWSPIHQGKRGPLDLEYRLFIERLRSLIQKGRLGRILFYESLDFLDWQGCPLPLKASTRVTKHMQSQAQIYALLTSPDRQSCTSAIMDESSPAESSVGEVTSSRKLNVSLLDNLPSEIQLMILGFAEDHSMLQRLAKSSEQLCSLYNSNLTTLTVDITLRIIQNYIVQKFRSAGLNFSRPPLWIEVNFRSSTDEFYEKELQQRDDELVSFIRGIYTLSPQNQEHQEQTGNNKPIGERPSSKKSPCQSVVDRIEKAVGWYMSESNRGTKRLIRMDSALSVDRSSDAERYTVLCLGDRTWGEFEARRMLQEGDRDCEVCEEKAREYLAKPAL